MKNLITTSLTVACILILHNLRYTCTLSMLQGMPMQVILDSIKLHVTVSFEPNL